jgi:hypothetical protein
MAQLHPHHSQIDWPVTTMISRWAHNTMSWLTFIIPGRKKEFWNCPWIRKQSRRKQSSKGKNTKQVRVPHYLKWKMVTVVSNDSSQNCHEENSHETLWKQIQRAIQTIVAEIQGTQLLSFRIANIPTPIPIPIYTHNQTCTVHVQINHQRQENIWIKSQFMGTLYPGSCKFPVSKLPISILSSVMQTSTLCIFSYAWQRRNLDQRHR